MKSLFIVMIGPAGSGKGYVEKYVREYFNQINIQINDTFEYALIDNYVEIDESFIRESLMLTQNLVNQPQLSSYIRKLNDFNFCNQEIATYNNRCQDSHIMLNLLEDYSKQYTDAYFKSRKNWNDVLDANIKLWLSQRKNIIFETVGTNNFDWLFNYPNAYFNEHNRNDYIVCLVYPYVDSKTILTRALHRYGSSVHDFITFYNEHKSVDNYVNLIKNGVVINHKQYKPPRYIRLFCDKFSLMLGIKQIHDNIANYISHCYLNNNNYLDMILIYDNTRNTPILQYDLTCQQQNIYCSDVVNNFEDYDMSDNLKNIMLQLSQSCKKSPPKSDINVTDVNDMVGGYYKMKYLKYLNKYKRTKSIV